MPRRLLCAAALCATTLPLAGCLSRVLPEPPPPALTYDFGPLPEAPPAALRVRFRLERVSAPSWLDTPSIYYRPVGEHPGALRAYAQNQWIAAAPELFAARLSHRLTQASPERAATELPLRIEIVSFEHVYTSTDEAYVLARVRASYEDLDGAVRRQEITRRRSAAAAVEGATETLPRVADDVVDGVLEWLGEQTLAAGR